MASTMNYTKRRELLRTILHFVTWRTSIHDQLRINLRQRHCEATNTEILHHLSGSELHSSATFLEPQGNREHVIT